MIIIWITFSYEDKNKQNEEGRIGIETEQKEKRDDNI